MNEVEKETSSYSVYANMMSLRVMQDMERSREDVIAAEKKRDVRSIHYERGTHKVLIPNYTNYGGAKGICIFSSDPLLLVKRRAHDDSCLKDVLKVHSAIYHYSIRLPPFLLPSHEGLGGQCRITYVLTLSIWCPLTCKFKSRHVPFRVAPQVSDEEINYALNLPVWDEDVRSELVAYNREVMEEEINKDDVGYEDNIVEVLSSLMCGTSHLDEEEGADAVSYHRG